MTQARHLPRGDDRRDRRAVQDLLGDKPSARPTRSAPRPVAAGPRCASACVSSPCRSSPMPTPAPCASSPPAPRTAPAPSPRCAGRERDADEDGASLDAGAARPGSADRADGHDRADRRRHGPRRAELHRLPAQCRTDVGGEHLLSSLTAALREAMKRGRNVTVVPADGSHWTSGWIVFVDEDASGTSQHRDDAVQRAGAGERDHDCHRARRRHLRDVQRLGLPAPDQRRVPARRWTSPTLRRARRAASCQPGGSPAHLQARPGDLRRRRALTRRVSRRSLAR